MFKNWCFLVVRMSHGIHEDKWTGIALCPGPQIAAIGVTADEFAIFQIHLIECYGANQIDADRVWSGQMGWEGSMAWSLNETWCSEAQNYGGKPSFTTEKPNFYGGKKSFNTENRDSSNFLHLKWWLFNFRVLLPLLGHQNRRRRATYGLLILILLSPNLKIRLATCRTELFCHIFFSNKMFNVFMPKTWFSRDSDFRNSSVSP